MNMDIFLLCALTAASALGLWVTIRLKEYFLNPLTLVVVTFCAPMAAALSRLSALQASEWHYNTYVVMFLVIMSWVLFPIVTFIAMKLGRDLKESGSREELLSLFGNQRICFLIRVVWIVVVSSYFLSNYVQARQIFITNPDALFSLHYEFPFGLRFFARATPALSVLVYLMFVARRRYYDLLLLFFSVFVPLSRGSRIDVAMSIVCVAISFLRFPCFQLTRKRVAALACVGCLVIVGGVEYGNQRLNRFGLYSVTYDKVIGWKSDVVGPSMILPTVYAYFPLSFENFDQFVSQSRGSTFGLMSFDWLFTGFVKANWLPGYNETLSEAAFIPVSAGANVPTALMPFYSDFGALGSVFPMMLCMGFLLWSYQKGKTSLSWFAVYALYSAAFSLSSFQGLIVSPIIAQQIAELLILFSVFRSIQAKARASSSPLS